MTEATVISLSRFDAVIFDMDGVVTQTAKAHAAAWQRLFDEFLEERAERRGEEFRPFDPRRDYRRYVDGKPRMDGVRSFLESRGIELPEGDEDDGPERETVSGLGNRKDRYFNAWLDDNQVRAYPGTLRLIDDLRAAGLKVAVFSASRNAEAVLRNAGVLELFDAKVDGSDAAELGLPGKPDPAVLLEAARRLGTAPAHTAVFEDAIAGVEAGVGGGFGFVIGVARGDYDDELKQAGAQLVVHDLSELRFTPGGGLTVKTLVSLPSVWDREEEIRDRLSGQASAVFLDYDGTLTPIVEDHTKAFLSDDMRAAVAALAQACKVAIISGRDLKMLKQLVKLDSVFLAGSHGFEIIGPDDSTDRLERGVEFLPKIDEAERLLRERLADIPGHAVERKRFSIAVHYRQASDDDRPRIEAIVDEVLAGCGDLNKGHGKKVFRIQPKIDWDKGQAVLWLLERFKGPDALPIYVGDDLTDEDAFRALAGRGFTIVVRDDERRRTAADYAVEDTGEVKRFLETLTAMVADSQEKDGEGR